MADKVETWAKAEGIVKRYYDGAIDDWQRDFIDGGRGHTLINCSRQSGKSTTASMLALHTSIYNEDSLTLLVSPSQRQSNELFRKVRGMMDTMRSGPPRLYEDNVLSCQFEDNDSRIVSLPDKEATIRGYSKVNLLIEDEASRVSDGLYLSTRPMLAISRGRHVLMSTPYGKRGHFFTNYDNCIKGGAEWHYIEVRASELTRFDPAFLAAELQALGEMWYSQEYECTFLDIIDTIFPYDLIEKAFTDEETEDPFMDLII